MGNRFSQKLDGRFRMTQVAGLCPKCYGVMDIGDIEVSIKAHLSEGADSQSIALHGNKLCCWPNKYEHDNGLDRKYPIEVQCPDCGAQMILVDSEMATALAALNRLGAYTVYSCAGAHRDHYEPHAIMNAYIKFARKLPDEICEDISKIGDMTFYQTDYAPGVLNSMIKYPNEDISTKVTEDDQFKSEGYKRFIFGDPIFLVEMEGWAVNINDLNREATVAYCRSEQGPEIFWSRLADYFATSEAGQKYCKENLKRWPTLYDYYADLSVEDQ